MRNREKKQREKLSLPEVIAKLDKLYDLTMRDLLIVEETYKAIFDLHKE